MGNVMEFALGLESSNFLRELGVSSRELLEFAGIGEAVKFSMESMFSAMERGKGLEELSARTNESVGHLYQLEEAFKSVGLGADGVGPMILKVRKSLSGINEMGGQTGGIFAALGLDRASLAANDPFDSIQKIAEAIHKLNPNDATGAANGLFGRNGAGDFLQIAGSIEKFDERLTESTREALLFQDAAKGFANTVEWFEKMESKVESFWAALSVGLEPQIKKIQGQIDSIDFTGIGIGISHAISEGKSVQLFQLGLEAGFEQAGFYGEKVFRVLAVSVGDFFSTALTTAFEDAIPSLFDTIKTGAKLLSGDIGETLNQQYAKEHYARAAAATNPDDKARELELGNKFAIMGQAVMDNQEAIIAQHDVVVHAHILDAVDTLKNGFISGLRDAKAAADGGPDWPHEKLDQLNKFLELLGGPGGFIDSKSNNGDGQAMGNGGYKPEVTDLEKIGFVFNTTSTQEDHARNIAENTRQTFEKCSLIAIGIEELVRKNVVQMLNE